MSEEELLDILDIPDHLGSNADLAAYADEHAGEPTPKDPQTPRREPGPCYECSKIASAHCLRCERPACARHHLVMYGLCQECARGTKRQEGGRPQGLDVPWIE